MIPLCDEAEDLSAAEYRRYARQIILPEVGIEGQKRLKRARVLVVGSGGLGSPVTLYLAAAGVGFIDLVDFDKVDVSNLHRQVLFSNDDEGKAKVLVAAERLRKVNPHTVVTPIDSRLNAGNAEALIGRCDLVIDCTDNFQTRYLVNDACLRAGKAYVYASIFQFEGHLSVFASKNGPCYRCIHPEMPPAELVPACAEGGVLGVLPGVMGTLQGVEAVKLLLGIGSPLIGRLLQYDALHTSFREFEVATDPHCPACAPGCNPTLSDQIAICAAPQAAAALLTPPQLVEWIESQTRFVLIDVRKPNEHSVSCISGDRLIPLHELGTRTSELPCDQPIVCYCLSGMRSKQAAELLIDAGFTQVFSLRGGILAWNSLDRGAAR